MLRLLSSSAASLPSNTATALFSVVVCRFDSSLQANFLKIVLLLVKVTAATSCFMGDRDVIFKMNRIVGRQVFTKWSTYLFL